MRESRTGTELSLFLENFCWTCGPVELYQTFGVGVPVFTLAATVCTPTAARAVKMPWATLMWTNPIDVLRRATTIPTTTATTIVMMPLTFGARYLIA